MKHEFKKCLGCLEFLRQKHRYHLQKSNINSDEILAKQILKQWAMHFSNTARCVLHL